MKDKVLAKADFRVYGTAFNKEFDTMVHAELLKSTAFQYGNGTCMIYVWGGDFETGEIESVDTRYEKVSADNFTEYAKGVLVSRCAKTLKVEAI